MNQVKKHFDTLAPDYVFYKQRNWLYYTCLKELLARLIPAGKTVLEVGCGSGDLLASLKPEQGYGIDISSAMIRLACSRHRSPKFLFSTQPVEKFKKYRLDCIFMSDVVEHLKAPRAMFKQIAEIMSSQTRFIITMANPLWGSFLVLAEKLGLKMPEGPHHRWTGRQVIEMLQVAGLRLISHDRTLLVPIPIPLVTKLANKYLEAYLKPLAFIEYFVVTKP